jgi:CBS domain-containing protein
MDCDMSTATQTPGPNADTYANLISTPVRSLIQRPPVTLPPETPIIEVARVMQAQRISSVLLVKEGSLFGLVTDRDLRNRVVAAGLDTSRPVVDIATLAPLTIGIESPAFDALLLMARHNVHHVPVLDGQLVVGMITSTNITEQQSNSAVYLAGAIYRQESLEGLVQVSGRIKNLQQGLAAARASAHSTGYIISAISDALTARLLQLAEAELGPPPVDYAWVAAGSQGRNEQTAKSDQDNCMVLDDAYDEVAHGAYFRELSRRVCDGLDACGYVHCPGLMMAMTDQWRQPQKQWRMYFRRWIDMPEPEALMLTGVFLDQRFVYGRADLINDLRAEVVARTKGNKNFLVYLASNALERKPPLNWMGRIAPIKGGEHDGKIDLGDRKSNRMSTSIAHVWGVSGMHTGGCWVDFSKPVARDFSV